MVTGEVGAISDNGTFRVAVTHTNYPSPICFNVYFRGVRHRYCENLPPQNPNYADLSAMCMTEPSELRIVPIDCGQDEYLPGEWKTTISPPPGATKPTVSVTTDKAFDPVAQRIRNKATVKWEFGAATNGWSVRLDAMPWATADGAQHAGSVLWNVGPTVARIGTKDYYFDSPGGAQQYLIKATAEACSGKTTDDAAAECTPCDGTASDDPVYFNDGNVGVSDGDPLPAIAGVTLARSYNSNEQVVALFGRGWTTLFDRRLIVNADGGESVISVTTETNDVVTFRGTGGSYRQTWPKARHAAGTLQYVAL